MCFPCHANCWLMRPVTLHCWCNAQTHNQPFMTIHVSCSQEMFSAYIVDKHHHSVLHGVPGYPPWWKFSDCSCPCIWEQMPDECIHIWEYIGSSLLCMITVLIMVSQWLTFTLQLILCFTCMLCTFGQCIVFVTQNAVITFASSFGRNKEWPLSHGTDGDELFDSNMCLFHPSCHQLFLD